MILASPWAFGAVTAEAEFALFCGVALLLVLWAARVIVAAQFSWRKCPVALSLVAIFLLGVWQIAPLPRSALRRLSPATAAIYERLLPAQPERVGPDVPSAATGVRPGSTISLYPEATRRMLLRILAVFALFLVVRNNVSASGALRRLGFAALVNGALLSLFGLLQYCTVAHNIVYWRIATDGAVFGPFVNRDHFAFYINMCIGLGLGLFLSMPASRPKLHEGRIFALLLHPESLWALAALATMLGASLFCLSPGATSRTAGVSLVCAPRLAFRHRVRGSVAAPVAALVAAGLAAGVFLVYEPSLNRLTSLWSGSVRGARPVDAAHARRAGGQAISDLGNRLRNVSIHRAALLPFAAGGRLVVRARITSFGGGDRR